MMLQHYIERKTFENSGAESPKSDENESEAEVLNELGIKVQPYPNVK